MNQIMYSEHLNSKLHRKNLRINILNEIKSAGSFKKYLINKGFITKRNTQLNKLKHLLYINSMKKMLK